MSELEELQKRILDLENKKTGLEDLIPWHQNERPKIEKELSGLTAELHELRKELNALKADKPKNEVKIVETESGDEPWLI